MITETFTTRLKPETAAKKALKLIRQSRLRGAKFTKFHTSRSGDSCVVTASEEDGWIMSGAEVRVEARDYWGATQVEVTATSDRFTKIVQKVRKGL